MKAEMLYVVMALIMVSESSAKENDVAICLKKVGGETSRERIHIYLGGTLLSEIETQKNGFYYFNNTYKRMIPKDEVTVSVSGADSVSHIEVQYMKLDSVIRSSSDIKRITEGKAYLSLGQPKLSVDFNQPIPPASEVAGGKEQPVIPRPTIDSGGEGDNRLVFIGDSLTAGSGVCVPNMRYPRQVSRMYGLAGRSFYSFGFGGATSETIVEALSNVNFNPTDVTIIWVGRNNSRDDNIGVVRDIGKIVDRLRNNRYLILSVIKGNYPSEKSGEVDALKIDALNKSISQKFGSHYVEIRDDFHESERFGGIHLSDLGYERVARIVYNEISRRQW